MTKCGVFSPAATDAEMGFIPASIEVSPHYVGDKHSGRLRGMVFVGAPVGDDESGWRRSCASSSASW